MTKSSTTTTKYKKGKHYRGGRYKLAYRPVNYYGTYAKYNNVPEDQKPLLYFKNNTLNRCYVLTEKYSFVWAAIYKMDAPDHTPPVAIWTPNNKWNNPVNG